MKKALPLCLSLAVVVLAAAPGVSFEPGVPSGDAWLQPIADLLRARAEDRTGPPVGPVAEPTGKGNPGPAGPATPASDPFRATASRTAPPVATPPPAAGGGPAEQAAEVAAAGRPGVALPGTLSLLLEEPGSGGPSRSSNLPDTGITSCYDNYVAIDCPAPTQPFHGQDAQYTTNPMSYTVSPEGLTVTDNVTGLMWQRCSAGLSGADCAAGQRQAMNLASAISYCENLELPAGGHTDWRLPDEYELQGLVDYSRPYPGPTIDTMAFPGTVSSLYWSSSTYANDATTAWYVSFTLGYVSCYFKPPSGYVRCVR